MARRAIKTDDKNPSLLSDLVQLSKNHWQKVSAIMMVVVALLAGGYMKVNAETYPGGSDNGLTSRLKSLSDTLTGLGFGSTTNTPDWGSMWNRVSTAAQFAPSGNATASDVLSGKTFYGNSRTQQTGTYVGPGACSTQDYNDNNGAPATQTTNCTDTITWSTPSPGVTGDDKKDGRTGLIWSQYLANSSGTVTFVASGGSTWSWDSSGTNNAAVGTKTASQLCSDRGNGWRLPSMKELLQAYIDGSYFNLTQPGQNYWSTTQNSAGTSAYKIALDSGVAVSSTKTQATNNVRCVR